MGRREVERRWARRGVSLDWPNVKGDKKREKTARERERRGKGESERREYVILDSLIRCTTT